MWRNKCAYIKKSYKQHTAVLFFTELKPYNLVALQSLSTPRLCWPQASASHRRSHSSLQEPCTCPSSLARQNMLILLAMVTGMISSISSANNARNLSRNGSLQVVPSGHMTRSPSSSNFLIIAASSARLRLRLTVLTGEMNSERRTLLWCMLMSVPGSSNCCFLPSCFVNYFLMKCTLRTLLLLLRNEPDMLLMPVVASAQRKRQDHRATRRRDKGRIIEQREEETGYFEVKKVVLYKLNY